MAAAGRRKDLFHSSLPSGELGGDAQPPLASAEETACEVSQKPREKSQLRV